MRGPVRHAAVFPAWARPRPPGPRRRNRRRSETAVRPGSRDGPLSVRGCPSTVKGHPKILSKPLRRKHLRDPPLERRSLYAPSGQIPRVRQQPARTGRGPSPASCEQSRASKIRRSAWDVHAWGGTLELSLVRQVSTALENWTVTALERQGRILTEGLLVALAHHGQGESNVCEKVRLGGRSFSGGAWPGCAFAPISTSTCRWMLCEGAGGMPNGLGSTCCGTATPWWSRTGRGTRCSTVRRR